MTIRNSFVCLLWYAFLGRPILAVTTAFVVAPSSLSSHQHDISRQHEGIVVALSSSSSSLSLSSDSTSPVSSSFTREELLDIAQTYISNPTPEALSPDFIFRGPVIGPLNKADFVETLTSISSAEKKGFKDAFPDLQPNVFGFTIDPIEPNRVWYFERPTGTFTGPFDHPTAGRIEPTGAPYVGPPEARSVIIEESTGLIQYQSVGYVMDRFTRDTTEGKAAVFGIYHVMGQSLDDTVGSAQMRFVQWVTSILPKELGIPKSFSKKEELPSWWTDDRMGAEK
mmetsp:Transcript_26454/g.37304  ORF Transcript_26454/g.37304 Transcript_26454/m.37304 type:complete len:282 (-) Transcript_26454:206-1051(-)